MHKVTLPGGLEVDVVGTAEAEKASVVVCMPVGPSRFDDNEFGICAGCGISIMFRPYMPEEAAQAVCRMRDAHA